MSLGVKIAKGARIEAFEESISALIGPVMVGWGEIKV